MHGETVKQNIILEIFHQQKASATFFNTI